jgi:5-methylcytosine-specific restriction endonuclease McrA
VGATAETSGSVMHVDHIKPRWKYPELSLSFENLQVLCKDCNLGKGGWDETDWREPEKLPDGAEEHMREICGTLQ